MKKRLRQGQEKRDRIGNDGLEGGVLRLLDKGNCDGIWMAMMRLMVVVVVAAIVRERERERLDP